MRIPSYDDLTPSIPDVSPGEVFSSVASLLPRVSAVSFAPGVRGATADAAAGECAGDSPARRLFAALHGGPVPALLTIARDFSPRIESRPGGTVVLDVSGLQRLFGDAAAIADHLARAGTPRVGIAATQTAAILLARSRGGISVAAGDADVALQQLPLADLEQLAGEIDAASARLRPSRPHHARSSHTFDVLRRWGLTTIGEFAVLPASQLSARLGATGLAHQRLARGIDPRPLVPDPAVRRFLGTFELEWPVDTLEPLSFVFARVLDPLTGALERADRAGVALHLHLRLADRTTYTRTLSLPAPMRDAKVLRTLLLLDLESHPPAAAVDVVTIEIDPAPGRIVQYSLLERPVPSPETLATLIARLGALVGETRCGSPRLLDTHQPDAWAMTAVTFEDRAPFDSSTPRPGGQASGPPAPRSGPPSGLSTPAAGRLALRRYRPEIAVRVTVESGRPARLAIDRRGLPGGAVRQAAGPWRTSGGWWGSAQWNRDEWDVALEDGAVCRIFQDRVSGGWFVEGIYD